MSNKIKRYISLFAIPRRFADRKSGRPGIFNSKGFTFVETLAALFIIMVGISSLATLINQTLSYAKASSYNLVAAYLGKEGIEVVKNIRDSNFLKVHYETPPGAVWTDGLTGCAAPSGCQADYTSTVLTGYTGAKLKLPASEPRFYNYSTGTDTLYSRRIIVDPIGAGPDYLKVTVQVIWSEKGRDHTFVAQENLYPWW